MKEGNVLTLEHAPAMDHQSETDKEQYQQFLSGSNEAFELLVIKYKDHLIYFINRYTKNITVAEDLAQDAFVELLVHKERYDFSVSFKTYLFTIGRNKAVDYIRKNQRVWFVDELPEQADEAGLEQSVIQEDSKKLLYQTMKKLKPDYQAAISLIDLEGMSYAQAANVLGKSDAQMKILIHRARKGLKKLMEREGFVYEE